MNFNEAIVLKKDREFRVVYKKGKSVANRLLVMYLLENNLDTNRVGFSVSKKVGNSVVRSRMKRLLRENFRLYDKEYNLKKSYDIIFICRVSAKDSDFETIKKSMFNLLKKSNVI